MSKINNEHILFDLIHSMTKAEKRSFKLFAKRSTDIGHTKFVRLFDIMEKMSVYNESAIMKKMTQINKPQFSNLKAHLYSQLLASLRQNFLNHDVDIQLREQLDYIRLLYKKGLYGQSLKLLNKAKNITGYYRKDLFQLSLLDYEKQIRSQQVFDLEEEYVDLLNQDTQESIVRFSNVQHFFSMAIKLKALFIERGMAKNENEKNEIKKLFRDNMISYNEEDLAFNERFYLYRAYYWYSYLIYDFESCVIYAEKWVVIFEESGLSKKRTAGYLKGLNRLLQSTYRMIDLQKFEKHYEQLIIFERDESANLESNAQMLLIKYITMQTLNLVFLNADFQENKQLIIKNYERVLDNKEFIDQHSLLVINYKMGVYFFALNEYDQSLAQFDELINHPENLRSDLKNFARIVQLIIHYENSDYEKLEKSYKTTLSSLSKQDHLIEFYTIILAFINKLGIIYPQDLIKEFQLLKKKVVLLKKDQFQIHSLLYFDMMSWIDAKIEGRSFAEVVKGKIDNNL